VIVICCVLRVCVRVLHVCLLFACVFVCVFAPGDLPEPRD